MTNLPAALLEQPQTFERESAIMAPKGKATDKGGAAKASKGKGKTEQKEDKGGKVKGAQQINVRHILVHLHFPGRGIFGS